MVAYQVYLAPHRRHIKWDWKIPVFLQRNLTLFFSFLTDSELRSVMLLQSEKTAKYHLLSQGLRQNVVVIHRS